MSSSPAALHEVLVEGLSDPTPEGQVRFHAAMRATFGVAEERSRVLVANLPRAVLRTQSWEEAQRAHEALRMAGALSRIQSAVPAPASSTPPTAAIHPTPAPQPVAVAPPAPPPPDAAAPTLRPVTPALSATPTPSPLLPPPPTAGSVLCRECGALQPEGNKTCARCAFPLPQKKPAAARSPAAASVAAPLAPAAASAAHARPRHGQARAEDDSTPCKPMRIMAASLMWLGAVSAVAQFLVIPNAPPSQLAGVIGPILFGLWLLGGSKAARVVTTIIAVVGACLILLARVGLSTVGSELGIDGMDALANVLLAQVPFLILFIAMLWGRGSTTKAWALGVPCLLIQAWSMHAMTVGEASKPLQQLVGMGETMTELVEVRQMVESGRTDAAITRLEAIAERAREAEDDLLLGNVLLMLGGIQLGAGRVDAAIEALEEASELRPDDENVDGLLEKAYAIRDQKEQRRQQRELGQDEEAWPEESYSDEPWPEGYEEP